MSARSWTIACACGQDWASCSSSRVDNRRSERLIRRPTGPRFVIPDIEFSARFSDVPHARKILTQARASGNCKTRFGARPSRSSSPRPVLELVIQPDGGPCPGVVMATGGGEGTARS